jgi:hypothetical protein
MSCVMCHTNIHCTWDGTTSSGTTNWMMLFLRLCINCHGHEIFIVGRMVNRKEYGRKRLWRTIPLFSWRWWYKPREMQVIVIGTLPVFEPGSSDGCTTYCWRSRPVIDLSTPNIIANVRHAWLDDCAVRAIRKKLKLIYDGGTLSARHSNEAMMEPMVGSGGVCVWRDSGVRWPVLCWCVWQESGFSSHEDVFKFFPS